MSRPDATLVLRFAKSDEHPYVAELQGLGRRQTHHFGDAHSRDEFVSGVNSFARLLGAKVVEVRR